MRRDSSEINDQMHACLTPLKVDGLPIDYTGLPENHRETVCLYLEYGCQPGGGWLAILEWRLDAVLIVDEQTAQAMPQIVRWLRNHAPSDSFGSREKVVAWIKKCRAIQHTRK